MAVDNMKKKAKRKPGGGRKTSKPDYMARLEMISSGFRLM